MKRHLHTFLVGAFGMGAAYLASIPEYHHLAGLRALDCERCARISAQQTYNLIQAAQAAGVSSESPK